MTPINLQETNAKNQNYNYIFPTENGKESTSWKYHLIDHAKQSIELSPNFCGKIDFEVCLEKIRENLLNHKTIVHIIASKDFIDDKTVNVIKQLSLEFPNRFHVLITDRKVQINPLATIENHEKLLVVDEKYFVMGGSGISPSMSEIGDRPALQQELTDWKDQFVSTVFRDMDVVGKGPVSVDFRRHFFSLYKKWEQIETGKEINRSFTVVPEEACEIEIIDSDFLQNCFHPSPKYVPVKALFSKPETYPPVNEITKEICNRISASQDNIRIAHMLFNPDQSIKDALEELKKNRPNIKISLITNSLNDDSPMANHTFVWANRSNYTLVSDVFEYSVPKVLYHKKVMTFDDRFTIIGSYNLGQKSAHFDDEVAVVVDSPEFTRAVNRILDSDINLSTPIDEAAKKEFQLLMPQIIGAMQQSLLGSFLG